MPDERDEELADEETTPETPLHGYKEGRQEPLEGDPEPEVGEEGDSDEGVGNPVGEKGDKGVDNEAE